MRRFALAMVLCVLGASSVLALDYNHFFTFNTEDGLEVMSRAVDDAVKVISKSSDRIDQLERLTKELTDKVALLVRENESMKQTTKDFASQTKREGESSVRTTKDLAEKGDRLVRENETLKRQTNDLVRKVEWLERENETLKREQSDTQRKVEQLTNRK